MFSVIRAKLIVSRHAKLNPTCFIGVTQLSEISFNYEMRESA
jgi:hypothetical protein